MTTNFEKWKEELTIDYLNRIPCTICPILTDRCECSGISCFETLKQWAESEYIEPVKTVWDLEAGDECWFIGSSETFAINFKENTDNDRYRDAGNLRLTQKEAQKEIEKRKATVRVKKRIAELNGGWVPDLKNIDEYKYYIICNHHDDKLDIGVDIIYQRQDSSLYLKSRELAEQLIKEMPEDLKTMLEVE